jgi:hypothetical protein
LRLGRGLATGELAVVQADGDVFALADVDANDDADAEGEVEAEAEAVFWSMDDADAEAEVGAGVGCDCDVLETYWDRANVVSQKGSNFMSCGLGFGCGGCSVPIQLAGSSANVAISDNSGNTEYLKR